MTSYPSFRSRGATLNHLEEVHPYFLIGHEALSKYITTLTEHSLTFSSAFETTGGNSARGYLSYRIAGLSLNSACRLMRSLIQFAARPRSILSLTRVSVENDLHEREIGLEDGWIISLTVGMTVSKTLAES